MHKVKRERIHSIKRGGWEVLEGAGEERSPAKDNQVDTHWQDAKPISTCAFPQLLCYVHKYSHSFTYLVLVLQVYACFNQEPQADFVASNTRPYCGRPTILRVTKATSRRKSCGRCCCLQQWEIETDRQKERQTDRQTERQTDRQTDRQTHRHTEQVKLAMGGGHRVSNTDNV